MTWSDGQGYRLFGIRGLFRVHGFAGILASVGLMIFLRRRVLKPAIDPDDRIENYRPETKQVWL
jgi:hypothetical protein